ncbi:MAG TPA: cytochrome C oxidase subunit IV family protein [Sandaracinaceae bacterium]
MSDHGHGHDDGAVHVHVHSTKLYATVLGILLFLTVVTVAASYVDIDGLLALGREVKGVGAWNLTVAILIATTKAAFVVLFFMHLKDDSRFNALVFIGGVLFVGVFLAYTMNDTAVRGTMDRYNGVTVDPDTGLPAPGGIPDHLRQQLMPTVQPEGGEGAGAAESGPTGAAGSAGAQQGAAPTPAAEAAAPAAAEAGAPAAEAAEAEPSPEAAPEGEPAPEAEAPAEPAPAE